MPSPKQIAEILGFELEDEEWRLILRDEDDEPVDYIDFTDEIKELVELFNA